MIVNVVEILIEYISIMLCLHKAAKKKMIIDRYIVIFAMLNLLCVLLSHRYREKYPWIMLIMFGNFFVYTKMFLCKSWLNALKTYGIMLVTIPSLQLVIYFCTKFILETVGNEQFEGAVVNFISCCLIISWRKEYIFYTAKWLLKSSGLIVIFIFWFFFAYLLYSYKISDFVYKPVTLQSVAGIVGVGTILILWINAENERRNKAKEVQVYELYNRTFEEAIIAIRARQHEFDNHINAIKCLQFTIKNPKDLVRAQNEYCNKVLNENAFNTLLKLNSEPIVTGFLYSKFMNAKEHEIDVVHDIHAVSWCNIIKVNEIIEVMGILIDNAVEAILNEKGSDKKLIVKILQEDKERILIEVANNSRKYLNREIEKFFVSGYSTKGDKRGMGLVRAKEILKKYKANILIENVVYNGCNYLSFKIYLGK